MLVALLPAGSPAPDDNLVQFQRSVSSQAALALQNALYFTMTSVRVATGWLQSSIQ